jgi:5-methylthioadenosine/S-adenosylhomocysteine deaminase
MERIDTLITPRWCIAVEPTMQVQEGVSLAVDKGRIVALLPTAEALGRFSPGAVHERPDHVLIPGLVNAHTHAAMNLFRGFADDIPLREWLEEHIWPAEGRWVSPEFVADGTRLAIAEMLRGGITCFADMYYFPDVVADAAVAAGMRAAVGMIVLEFPTAWAQDAGEYLTKGLAVRDRFKGHPLITTTFAPHAPYTVGDETLQRVRQLADQLEVPVHIHVHETAHEISESLSQYGRRPLARLEGLGLVTPGLMAVHATQLDGDEIDGLARAGAHVVHCPRSNLKLASGACRVAELSEAGVNVALGTDGAASNNRLDLLAEMQLAALLAKLTAADACAVPAAEALRMATINGARALNLEQEIGSLTPGKSADVTCIALAGLTQDPVFDPLSALVYTAGREQVSDVWIAGQHLLNQGELSRFDPADLRARADHWQQRLLEFAL